MKTLLLLFLTMSIIGCKKELKLASCNIDVFHKANISKTSLEQIADRAFYEKGWDINYIKYENRDEVNSLTQHAFLNTSMTSQKHSSYRYVSTCKTAIRVYSPESKKKSFLIKKEASEETPGLHHCTPGADYYCEKVQETCNNNALSIVDELPSCTLK